MRTPRAAAIGGVWGHAPPPPGIFEFLDVLRSTLVRFGTLFLSKGTRIYKLVLKRSHISVSATACKIFLLWVKGGGGVPAPLDPSLSCYGFQSEPCLLKGKISFSK